MDIVVSANGLLAWGPRHLRCAVGRSGIRTTKVEGDGATPAGRFPLRCVRYRADRLPRPPTRLPVRAIDPADGWCDDPDDARYNRPIVLPYPARHERLWRPDRLYDVLAVIGYNDDPVVVGLGSAIFLHVATGDYAATEGCVAIARKDLLELLADLGPGDGILLRV
jgi:L,D-peptidoglycan transpeptidase YkuD (ErfK/YbiS/YcfS/YnhG family)